MAPTTILVLALLCMAPAACGSGESRQVSETVKEEDRVTTPSGDNTRFDSRFRGPTQANLDERGARFQETLDAMREAQLREPPMTLIYEDAVGNASTTSGAYSITVDEVNMDSGATTETSDQRQSDAMSVSMYAMSGPGFVPQDYFTVLKHLSMEEEWVLDCFENRSDLAGAPTVYPRRIGDKPYTGWEELEKDFREQVTLERLDREYERFRQSISNWKATGEGDPGNAYQEFEDALARIPHHGRWNWYLDRVKTDGSDEGYLEYCALYLLGGQFNLFWHAYYDDTRIIADRKAMEEQFGRAAFPGRDAHPNPQDAGLPKELWQRAMALDLTPRVDRRGSGVTVSVVTFSNWRGFERRRITIAEDFPHRIIRDETEVLVAYDCGVFF